jgi:hypothetical protein
MIKNDDGKIPEVAGLNGNELERVRDFLQGAVYCWCKNRPGEWFSMRDLMGGVNRNWSGTPLSALYDRHIKEGKSPDEAFGCAGQDSGKILKKVIADDKKFEFETKTDALIRQYRWIEVSDAVQ